MSLDLLSDMYRVETPFIIAEIAGISFGAYEISSKNHISGNSPYNATGVVYPNFMKGLTITKINGAVNTYTLNMVYAIRNGDDPNFLEKVFSKAKNDRLIKLSYGDMSMPSYIYKTEEAIMTDVKSSIDFSGSKITYTIQCTSRSLLTNGTKYNFPKRFAKPSDVILELLYSNLYGLTEIFYGMINKAKVIQNQLIASDDIAVTIEAKQTIGVLDYIQYLVNCMTPANQPTDTLLKSAMYRMCVVDDTSGEYGGPYLKVSKISRNIRPDTIDVYTINVGYPDKNVVINFDIQDNQVFSIFYDYAGKIGQPEYIQRIDNDGNLVSEYSPGVSNSPRLLRTTASDRMWWTNMINYPISATLKIKGLIKPAILMSYVYIDARFFGAQHYATGYYIITKQVDEISASGYRTTLSLLKVGGETLNVD